MEAHKHCLNCDTELISEYCHKCGQKKAHRITLKHFIAHDLVHGIWHFDKGLLYTLRESLLRPGYMAVNYIKGKRVRYYNIFYLLLLVLGINAVMAHYFRGYYHISEERAHAAMTDDKTFDASHIIDHYFKLLLFLMIPVFALSGIMSFRKLKLNFAEQAIIAGNVILTGALWTFIYLLFYYATWPFDAKVIDVVLITLLSIIILCPIYVYYQVTRHHFSFPGFLWRMLSWYAWCLFQFFIVLLIGAAITGKTNFNLSG